MSGDASWRDGYEAGLRANPAAVRVAAPLEVERLRKELAELRAASQRSVNLWAHRLNALEDLARASGATEDAIKNALAFPEVTS